MLDVFKQHTDQLKRALDEADSFHDQVAQAAGHLKEAFARGHKVLVAGNGGSAAQAQHFSDEMVGRYKANRDPYAVVALTADGPVLTCIGNDFGFEQVFSRQVQALGRAGDVLMALSTSGNSSNILAASQAAHDQGMTVIALTGRGGKLKDVADVVVAAPADSTARIQELHLHAIHLICEVLEDDVAVQDDISRSDGGGMLV